MQFSKISSATAALLISTISASPIAMTYDAIHPSESIHVKPTGSIEHSFKIHPTGSFNPKEPIPTCTDEENSKFTIRPIGGKTGPHHYRPSGTGIKSHEGPKPTGHVSKSHESSHSKPSGHVSQRAIESNDDEGSTVSKFQRAKPTGNAFHEHESGYARPTGSGKKGNAHPSGTGVYKDENPRQNGYAKPTETKDRKTRESGHAKASGKGGKEGEFGHAKPTDPGAEHGHAEPTGVHSQIPEFTGTHKSRDCDDDVWK